MDDGPQNRFGGAFESVTPEAWAARVRADLRGKSADSLARPLTSEVWLDPLYAKVEPDAVLPPSLRPKGGWLLCAEVGAAPMERAAEEIQRELEGGARAVWLRTGLDHGTRVLTAGDLAHALRSFPLGEVPLYLEPRIDALSIAHALLAVARERGVPTASLRGCFGADPLGALAYHGSLAGGLRSAFEEAMSSANLAQKHAPQMRALLIDTRPYQSAGASVSAEVAWAAATGLAYARRLVGAGHSIEEAFHTLQFAVGLGSQILPEVAKLRALRWVWAKVVAAVGGGAAAQTMQLHVTSDVATRSRYDPATNILRGTLEAFAGVVGGADSICVLAPDAALGEPDPLQRRIARNTQHVLREECSLGLVDDPAAGSYAIESLTNSIAKEAWAELQDVERDGGMMRAVLGGRVARSIASWQRLRIDAIATRKLPVVGVSVFADSDEAHPIDRAIDLREVEVDLGNELRSASPEDRHESVIALTEAVRRHRTAQGEYSDALDHAVDLGVDLVTLSTALRHGRASLHMAPLRPLRRAAPWEALRDAVGWYVARHGEGPVAFIANIGPLAEHARRLQWLRSALAAAGIGSTASDEGYPDEGAAITSFEGQRCPLAVVCADDSRSASAALALAPALKAKGASLVLLAAPPGADGGDELRRVGVDEFLYEGADLLHKLAAVLEALGVAQPGGVESRSTMELVS